MARRSPSRTILKRNRIEHTVKGGTDETKTYQAKNVEELEKNIARRSRLTAVSRQSSGGDKESPRCGAGARVDNYAYALSHAGRRRERNPSISVKW